jgi:hypothetical protein
VAKFNGFQIFIDFKWWASHNKLMTSRTKRCMVLLITNNLFSYEILQAHVGKLEPTSLRFSPHWLILLCLEVGSSIKTILLLSTTFFPWTLD